MKRVLSGLGLLLGAALAMPATATTVFSQDFEGGISTGFTGGNVVGSEGYGAFGDGSNLYHVVNDENKVASDISNLTVNFGQATSDASIDLSLAIINSWDGKNTAQGPDRFTINLDGKQVFTTIFDNFDGTGPTKKQGMTSLSYGSDLGFDPAETAYNDAAYGLHLDLGALSAGTHVIQFVAHGQNWQGGTDESFGLDNVVVSASPVPEPASGALMMLGLLGLGVTAARRRKNG